MKSSSTYCVVARSVLVLGLATAAPSAAVPPTRQAPEELTNFLLSPEFSRWLVGPIAEIAGPTETRRYLDLRTDEEAAAFIEEFWNKRGGEAIFPSRGMKLIFDERAAEADRLFSEGTYRGRQTDRGMILVLYGPPEEVRYELSTRRRGEPIEVWEYPKDSEKGLDGRKPHRYYRFVKQGDLTVFYRGPVKRRLSLVRPQSARAHMNDAG